MVTHIIRQCIELLFTLYVPFLCTRGSIFNNKEKHSKKYKYYQHQLVSVKRKKVNTYTILRVAGMLVHTVMYTLYKLRDAPLLSGNKHPILSHTTYLYSICWVVCYITRLIYFIGKVPSTQYTRVMCKFINAGMYYGKRVQEYLCFYLF